MLSFQDALANDHYPTVCTDEEDEYLLDGWDVDIFPEIYLRKEIRMFAGQPPDIILKSRLGRTFAAHKDVLAECSYFDSMINRAWKEQLEMEAKQCLEINEDPDVLLELLRWIYCSDASVDKRNVHEVYTLADLYGLEGLVDHCARVLAALDMPKDYLQKPISNLADGNTLQRASDTGVDEDHSEDANLAAGGTLGAAGGGYPGAAASTTTAGGVDGPVTLAADVAPEEAVESDPLALPPGRKNQ